MKPTKRPEDKIIIALDVPKKEIAFNLIEKLKDVRTFKIGLELFISEGPSLLKKIHKMGKKIFLDLKLHDIPNTVAGAIRSGLQHRVSMMTLHASGGLDMMKRASDEANQFSIKTGIQKPLLLAVTVLTSFKQDELKQIGVQGKTNDQVLNLAGLAQQAGMDGLVCSPKETTLIKKEMGKDFVVVNPGIRPSWASKDDQKRITTPRQAVQNGADFLVMGRPVTQAPDPEQAFLKICQELDRS
jgi:orotidine-5'-phosphate decarboxylase